MWHAVRVGLVIGMTVSVAGCGRLGWGDSGGREAVRYEPLPASPTSPVAQTALPPVPPPSPVQQAPLDAPPPGPVAGVDPNQPLGTAPAAPGAVPPPVPGAQPAKPVAAADAKGPAIGRGDVAGGWQISGGDSCQLFTNVTAWSGGYRAVTRGCTSPDLQKVSAWDLSGRQVSLKGPDGTVVATVAAAGPDRFSGQTASGRAIALSR